MNEEISSSVTTEEGSGVLAKQHHFRRRSKIIQHEAINNLVELGLLNLEATSHAFIYFFVWFIDYCSAIRIIKLRLLRPLLTLPLIFRPNLIHRGLKMR